MTVPTAAGVTLYRIGTDAPAYEAHDLSGTGSKFSAGRWNRSGQAVVYASTTRALACLETLVHLARRQPLALNRYLVEIVVPDDAWHARTRFDQSLHVGWDAEPPGLVSLAWGRTWLQGSTSLLAEVPSAIVPEEANVLINPAHPEIVRVTARKVRRWRYDPRLR